jgi:hypothetical protein
VKTGKTFHDVSAPKEEVTVKPVEQQEEFESRKLWSLVAKGIREGDYEAAAREKSKIEVCRLADYDPLSELNCLRFRTTNVSVARMNKQRVLNGL